ncbi:Pam16-domain-containing protein [Lipomyces japonicus]|uniref:Pam16-domain-containing protein n=1 Tax=Lipomyces japonicus TaxID=56871 RepID=UPI0034CD0D30
MAHRILLQVVFTGAQVFGKAFVQAYKQAATTSASQAGTIAKEGGITVDEACRILHINNSADAIKAEAVKSRFDYLFAQNAKDKSGSFYIQSKVFRAKERLDKEIAKNATPPPPPPGTGTTGAGPSQTAAS